MTGYEAFALYQSLKLHFTVKSYDYFKYQGKVKMNVDAFENRKDKYYFHKISRKYDDKQLEDFLIANFLEDANVWIGKLFEEDAEHRFMNLVKINQSLSYTFENECRSLFQNVDNPNDILVTNGDYPILLKSVLRKEISIQTLVILNSILNFLPMWERNINDTIIWPNFMFKLKKYIPFLTFDVTKYKLILKKVLNEN